MANERTLYKALREGLLAAAWRRGIKTHVVRVENGAVAGTPDVNLCVEGKEWWIELKYARQEPKRSSTPLLGSAHRLSAVQSAWMQARRHAQGNVAVFIGTPQRRILTQHTFIPLNAMTVAELELSAIWTAGARVSAEEYDKLLEALLNV